MKKKCEIADCDNGTVGHKLYCKKHQTRFERHGDPNFTQKKSIKIGETFGRLTVKEYLGPDKNRNSMYRCTCECGGEAQTRAFMLNSGRAKSCGCLQREYASIKQKRIERTEKICSSCRKLQPSSEFGKKKTSVDGLKSQCNACGKNWKKSNPHKVSESNRFRKRQKNNATPSWVDRAALQEIDRQRIEIQEETGEIFDVDHIIPIIHPNVCGLHVPWNLQILDSYSNKSKGNRVDQNFLKNNGIAPKKTATKNQFVDSEKKLLKLWDTERNAPLKPTNVHLSYSLSVWWKCSKGHSWYKLIGSMIRDKSCPYCSGEILEGENYNNISPALEEEWDYQRNNPWTPENFTRQSNRSVFWKCENGHSYSKSIYARGRGVGCPVCKKLGLR